MIRNSFIFLLLVTVIVSLAACQTPEEEISQVDESETSNERVEEEENKEDSEPSAEFPYYAPLTGVGTDQELNDRIIAIMINNHHQARPHSGLDQADIIYEVLVEGAITRLLALYQSESPQVVGPVRSLRPYYLDLAAGFDAAVAHAGGSPAAKEEVRSRNMASLDGIGNASAHYERVSFREAPHNLYTGIEALREGIEARDYRLESEIPEILFKDPEEEMTGEKAPEIDIVYHSTYYDVSFTYDEEKEKYTRYVQGELQQDREREELITVSNLFVIETSHQILDDQGRRDIDLMSAGNGLLFQRGKVQEVEWENIDGVIRPVQNGEQIGLYPGKTWVNVVPTDPGLSSMVDYKTDDE